MSANLRYTIHSKLGEEVQRIMAIYLIVNLLAHPPVKDITYWQGFSKTSFKTLCDTLKLHSDIDFIYIQT